MNDLHAKSVANIHVIDTCNVHTAFQNAEYIHEIYYPVVWKMFWDNAVSRRFYVACLFINTVESGVRAIILAILHTHPCH